VIARLCGLLVEKQPTRVVLECRGIGFELRVPLSTSRRLADAGADVTLLVHTHFTREGVEFFGFLDVDERETFRRIITVKGIGPKAGLNLLSRFTPGELAAAIASGKTEVVRSVPGIGPKKAESLVQQLRDAAAPVMADVPMIADAVSALMSLGLTNREARERVARVQVVESMTLQELLRLALAQRA
jgi:holliday junction DNA helicase RuvA